jgi:succinate dehydrogenase/fumarate reductase iron-sulfur protein
MAEKKWNITLKVYRQKEDKAPYYDEFQVEVNPEENVLDVVERVWAFVDRTLCFRHACHHSTCGACGMRVNHVEKLTCITPVNEVVKNGGTLLVEPLRNFPVISDLAVDMGTLYNRLEEVGARSVMPVTEAEIEYPSSHWDAGDEKYIRLSDCIECGLCISACPSGATSFSYLGPAVLAAAQDKRVKHNFPLLKHVDNADGVWRCHSAFECTAVCPSFVDPARRIMDLRVQVLSERIKGIFQKTGEISHG